VVLKKEVSENNHRYERKFYISDLRTEEVEYLVHFHPSFFSEIYYTRHVNNIYFDSVTFKNYYDNLDGTAERYKMRIRWYGGLFGNVLKPVLEYKLKKGLLGDKKKFPLSPFVLDTDFDISRIFSKLRESELPELFQHHLTFQKPVLLNRYKRRYFQSQDNQFRITIDSELNYYSIHSNRNHFSSCVVDDYSTILELKYSIENDAGAKKISSLFPFRMTKNSKYVNGVMSLYGSI
jgi:hypothetical protein